MPRLRHTIRLASRVLPVALLLPALAHAQVPATAPQVRTAAGTVAGLVLPSGVRAFRGIPYAAPPVRELRWTAPRPARPWTGVRKADRFADQCMQARVFSDMVFRNEGTSEDCLYLNVWQPAPSSGGATAARRPVLVYFYGGGFVGGDGSEPRYDGESMAKRGIVVVTMSYRLGIFGFFVHPELTREGGQGASGNWALMDQAASLRWVKENIAAFGGDPAQVTIAGESAGSFSVSAQMASPMAAGLFARAIGESGAFFSRTLSTPPREEAERNGVAFGDSLGARSLASLRALSAHELLAASMRQGMPRFGPVVDGRFFREPPPATFAAGRQARVPLLAGWNSEEMGAGALLREVPNADNVRALLEKTFGARAGEAARHYPATSPDEALQSVTNLAGDQWIVYSTWKWLDEHARTSGQPVYRYLYARARPATAPGVTPAMPAGRGASHSAEIEYAMGNLATNHVFAWTDDDRKVSETMQGFFANFIRTGDPNGDGLPRWPVAKAGGDAVPMRMRIDVTSRAEPDDQARFQFLDRVYATP